MFKRFHLLMALILGVSLITAVGCGTKSSLRGSIVGTIVDSQTGIGIAGATVLTSPSTTTVITDINGGFSIPDVESGVYTLTAHASDYNSNSITVSVEEPLSTLTVIEFEL